MIRFPLAAGTAPHKDGCSEPLRAGVAIRAKVSDEVGSEIREQIKAGAFPVRLMTEERGSGGVVGCWA